MIRSFASRALRNFWDSGVCDGIGPEIGTVLLRRLDFLDAAVRLAELRMPGLALHAAAGRSPRICRIHVTGPCLLAFDWRGGFARSVALHSSLSGHSGGKKHKARGPARLPTHPGAVLREDAMPALGISVIAAAAQMSVSRQTLHRVLAETASVTPEMALRIGRLCGNGAAVWLRMQLAHDLWRADQAMGAEATGLRAVA